MEAQAALATLIEVSRQVESATIFEPGEGVIASTLDDEASKRVAARAAEILASLDDETVTQVEAATAQGSIFIVREGETAIVATTGLEPAIGLVMYDLRTCLRALATEKTPA